MTTQHTPFGVPANKIDDRFSIFGWSTQTGAVLWQDGNCALVSKILGRMILGALARNLAESANSFLGDSDGCSIQCGTTFWTGVTGLFPMVGSCSRGCKLQRHESRFKISLARLVR